MFDKTMTRSCAEPGFDLDSTGRRILQYSSSHLHPVDFTVSWLLLFQWLSNLVLNSAVICVCYPVHFHRNNCLLFSSTSTELQSTSKQDIKIEQKAHMLGSTSFSMREVI